jgi:hypothetical protein
MANSAPVQVSRPCLVCGKSCLPYEKNSDGTYAHDHCLRATSVRSSQWPG